MKHRCGAADVVWVLICLIIGLILVAIVGNFLFGIKGLQTYDKQWLKERKEVCEASRFTYEKIYGADIYDDDGDGYRDRCDICLGGDDSIDTDNDGVPDTCDNVPQEKPAKRTALKSICEGIAGAEWNERKTQCTLACYGDLKNPCPRQQKQPGV